jgi:hypothetical protein
LRDVASECDKASFFGGIPHGSLKPYSSKLSLRQSVWLFIIYVEIYLLLSKVVGNTCHSEHSEESYKVKYFLVFSNMLKIK